MVGIHKLVVVAGVSMSLSLGAMGGAEQIALDPAWYSNAVQNVISYYGEAINDQVVDLFSDKTTSPDERDEAAGAENICFNNESTSLELLAEQMKGSDSICLNGVDFGKQEGLVGKLAEILLLIGETGIDDRLINLNMEYLPKQRSPDCDILQIAPDGALSFAGKPIEISDLTRVLSIDRQVGIESDARYPPPPLSKILPVVKAVGEQRIHHLFIADRVRQVKVSARIFEVNELGEEDDLSCPMLTTQPGFAAMIRAVHNNSGYDRFDPANDPFYQEDLGNLGVRFSVKPALIGDYIRLSGAIVLVNQTGERYQVFTQGETPIYSFAAAKIVCPFSCVMPQDKEYVEIPVTSNEGIRTICRLSAILVDEKGNPRAQRTTERTVSIESEF